MENNSPMEKFVSWFTSTLCEGVYGKPMTVPSIFPNFPLPSPVNLIPRRLFTSLSSSSGRGRLPKALHNTLLNRLHGRLLSRAGGFVHSVIHLLIVASGTDFEQYAEGRLQTEPQTALSRFETFWESGLNDPRPHPSSSNFPG